MTQEEKQLLLKDLCARIPYDTLVQLNPGAYGKPQTCRLTGVDDGEVYLNVDPDPFRIYNIRPYLRPMSSMTKEEEKERNNIALFHSGNIASVPTYIDFLNKHHFDYRGLIEKGLALEAPRDMYKIN